MKGRDSLESSKQTPTSPETKGNVLVSVRVRPDAKSEQSRGGRGDWNVDGRKSLVSYQGKEGGDYYYGMEWDIVKLTCADLISR